MKNKTIDKNKIARERQEIAVMSKQNLELWIPKTEIGKKVKAGEITDLGQMLDNGVKILEEQIIDSLLPDIQSQLLKIGQSKGKFGGGKRSIWKQTQKKTSEGNKPKFSTMVVIGNKDGFIGIGRGKAKETVPAREKALRRAKLNIIKIKRGCGSWECACKEPHSIPFKVKGKCGSVIVELIPAPKGTGLTVEAECQRILSLAGIKDLFSRCSGQTSSKLNLMEACFDALCNLSKVRLQARFIEPLGVKDGKIK